MKHYFIIVFTLLSFSVTFLSCSNKPVQPSDMPETITLFLQQHFGNANVVHVQRDGRDYEVVLSNNTRLDFSAKGEWKEIESINGLPTSVIPVQIMSTLSTQFPDTQIKSIEKDGCDYDVDLLNGMEYKLSADGLLIEVD